MKNKVSLRSAESLLSKAGAKRSSENAKIQLCKAIHKHAEKISIKANTFSQHAKRKTIKKQDVILALKN